jgi:hypothetical protein
MKHEYSFNTIFSRLSIKERNSNLDNHIQNARTRVDDINTNIKKLYDKPDSIYTKKQIVGVKEKNLMGTLDKNEKRKFILKKKLYCVLSPFEDEERLVDDLIKLSNLKSLSELVTLNTGVKKKKDILKLFRLRRMKKESEEGLGNSELPNTGVPQSPKFRSLRNSIDEKSEINKQSNRTFLAPVNVKNTKYEKSYNPSPVKNGSPMKSYRSSTKVTPLVSTMRRTIDNHSLRNRKHLSSIF